MNVSQLRSRTQTLVQTQLSARIRNPLARSPRSTERALGRPRSLRVHSVGDFFQRVAVTAKRAMSATPWTAPDFYTSERWWTKDTIAVVTGSNKGIGAEVCRQLGAQGLTPVVTGRNEAAAKKTAAAIAADVGREVPCHQLDVMDPQSVAHFADYVQKTHGGLDVLVHNAAIAYKGSTFGPAETRVTLETNVYGMKRVNDALLPLMRPGGRIIIVGSSAGKLARFTPRIQERAQKAASWADIDALAQDFLRGVEKGDYAACGWPQTMYGVSKLAVAAYGRLLSKELEGKGISVSVVHPGYVATDMSSWNGELPASEGADSVTWLALAAKTTVPSGKFWYKRAEWGY